MNHGRIRSMQGVIAQFLIIPIGWNFHSAIDDSITAPGSGYRRMMSDYQIPGLEDMV
jgi:hypothetical protein